jgi:hypothetical protein
MLRITSVVKYFHAERRWYHVGIALSLISFIAALSFLSVFKGEFLRGLAYPCIGFSILQFIIYVLTLLKITKDTKRVSDVIRNQPERIRIDEFPRMRKVLRNLLVVKTLTILIAVIGLWMSFSSSNSSFLTGIGVGLFTQSILLYGVDHFALKGRLLYWNFLQSTYRFHQINLGFRFPEEHSN